MAGVFMKSLITGICLIIAPVALAIAEEMPSFELIIQNHLFQPEQLTVPLGKKVKLLVTNKDNTPEEFESDTPKPRRASEALWVDGL